MQVYVSQNRGCANLVFLNHHHRHDIRIRIPFFRSLARSGCLIHILFNGLLLPLFGRFILPPSFAQPPPQQQQQRSVCLPACLHFATALLRSSEGSPPLLQPPPLSGRLVAVCGCSPGYWRRRRDESETASLRLLLLPRLVQLATALPLVQPSFIMSACATDQAATASNSRRRSFSSPTSRGRTTADNLARASTSSLRSLRSCRRNE